MIASSPEESRILPNSVGYVILDNSWGYYLDAHLRHIEAETKWTPFRRRHFQVNENVSIPIKFSVKLVPKGPINNILALVQIMAWHRPGDKLSSWPMMVSLLTHICVTRSQWVKSSHCNSFEDQVPIDVIISTELQILGYINGSRSPSNGCRPTCLTGVWQHWNRLGIYYSELGLSRFSRAVYTLFINACHYSWFH